MKRKIEHYLREKRVGHLSDPSNRSTHFRQLIRRQWLPQLERFQTGAIDRLVCL
ncbi:MAG: hypothetical protein R2827_05320 [Bdellovibrionales bacterium]